MVTTQRGLLRRSACMVIRRHVGLWAAGLALTSVSRVFPVVVRLLGLAAAVLFASTGCRIFAGTEITALSQPLPFFAYPVLVATFVG
jgi:hypothetical protein